MRFDCNFLNDKNSSTKHLRPKKKETKLIFKGKVTPDSLIYLEAPEVLDQFAARPLSTVVG